ncbi:TPA: hypothetical protein OXC52_001131 [Enterobacter asburiae]|nr:hypothetical protein [Enterobacter asburiae]HCW3088103.1 hypothetical protein [Enterobacter asburiae]HCW3145919.1 hypothetical protein [Enterobacter asburiae]HCW3427953.1 hypothetical protein [Enterobacter asburiae]
MKKVFTDSLIGASYYLLLFCLLFATFTETSSLLSIVAAAYWVIVVLGIFVGLISMVLTFGLDYSTNKTSRKEGIDLLKRFAKRKGAFRRAWGWVCLLVGTASLAYGGWVFTAVAYALASLFVRLCCSLARDKVDKSSTKVEVDNAPLTN